MVLYENTIRNFMDSVFHGRLTGFLEEEYENALGKRPDPLMKAQWKYMMRLIYEYTVTGRVVGGVEPTCGIRIDLCLSSLQTSTIILLASKKDGRENVAILEMLPWESVRLSGEEDMVVYTDDTGEHEVIHPSYQILEYTKYISKGRRDTGITYRPFVYLHECEQLRETDIEYSYKPEIIRMAPIVYAGDDEEFISYTQEVLTGKDGSSVLRHLHKLEEMPIQDTTGGLFDDQKYIYALTRRYLATNRPAWFLIKNPPGSGASRLIRDIRKSAAALPGRLAIIEKDRKPSPEEFTKDGVTLWFYGEREEQDMLESIRKRAEKERVPVYDFTLHVPSSRNRSGDEAENEARNAWIREYAKSFTASELPEEEETELPDTDAAKKYYAGQIKKSMGEEAWTKMKEISRKWIISGVVAYNEMKEFDQLLDFSGVCIQICKAAETELSERLFSGFRDWLMAKYGSHAAEKAPYDMLEGKKGGTKFVEPGRISLGQYAYIIGLDHKGRVVNDYAWGEFEPYARETLLKSGLDPKKTMKEHLTYIEKIRAEYRNQAAHSESIDVTKAKSCIDYVVGTLHRLGVMLEDYRF